MAEDVRIPYRLPMSAIRFTGTTQYTTDTILAPGEEKPSHSAEITLETVADPSSRLIAKVDRDFLQDTKISFELTEDGRLVTGGVDTTGQAGKVIIGAVGVGASIAGVALGLPAAVAPALLSAAGIAAAEKRRGIAPSDTPEERVAKEYAKRFPGMLSARTEYAELVANLTAEIAKTGSEVASAKGSPERAELMQRLRALQKVMNTARAELDRLDEHFKAWRASTIKSREEHHEFLFELGALAKAGTRVEEGELRFPEPSGSDAQKEAMKRAQARVSTIWDRLGALVTLEDDGQDRSATDGEPQSTSVGEIEGVEVRVPHRVTLTLWSKADSGKAVRIHSKPYLITDEASTRFTMKWDESWFGKRSLKLSFSAGGALTSVSTESTSDAAAIAETAATLPATITGGLEQSSKLLDQVEALRTKAADQRLARLKKEIELKQQQILQDGLLATEASHAELERLKQEAAILEARGTIRTATDPSTLELENLKRQIELLKAQKEFAAAERELAGDAGDDLRVELIELVKAVRDAERQPEEASNGGATKRTAGSSKRKPTRRRAANR
jgi:hypothetical protein